MAFAKIKNHVLSMLYKKKQVMLGTCLLSLAFGRCSKYSNNKHSAFSKSASLLPLSKEGQYPKASLTVQSAMDHFMKQNPEKQKPGGRKHFDFEHAIQKLRELADGRRGVKWKLEGDTLFRDAREANGVLSAAEDYMVMVLNIYRAAKKMCTLYGKAGHLFEAYACQFMKGCSTLLDRERLKEDDWAEIVKRLNEQVVLELKTQCFPQESNLESINAKLRLAENYVGLEDRHYSVTTTFQIDSKEFALEDKKWLQLTEQQKALFKNRKSETWYQQLDPFEQKLVDAYLPKFLDGVHYIPTQLRYLVGCRNAYQKRILAYGQSGQSSVLGGYYHSGAFASLVSDKEVSEQIAKSNWKQICQHDPNTFVISLNHNVTIPLPGISDYGEHNIVSQTERIVGNDAFMYMPVNAWGTFSIPKFKPHVKELLQKAARCYEDKYPMITGHLTKEQLLPGEREKWLECINAIEDEKDKNYFQKLSFLKEAAGNSDRSNTWKQTKQRLGLGNYYADVVSSYISCRSLLDQRKGKSSILFSCKSGKDRTGFMSYLVDGNMIHMTHPSLNNTQDGQAIYRALAKAGHQQILSSLNGGTPGRFGMKDVQQNETALHIESSKQLFNKTARLTHISL